jgi:hypothetical protein
MLEVEFEETDEKTGIGGSSAQLARSNAGESEKPSKMLKILGQVGKRVGCERFRAFKRECFMAPQGHLCLPFRNEFTLEYCSI